LNEISNIELNRQFRVLNQTLSIHCFLRDRYLKYSFILDIIVLLCSVILCATIFAKNELYVFLGLETGNSQNLLGIFSVIIFFVSLLHFLVKWKEKSEKHKDAIKKLSKTLSLFRELQKEDKTWDSEDRHKLNTQYWQSMRNIVEIPEKLFLKMKAKHIRKVEVSKLSDNYKGCPIFILKIIVLSRSMKGNYKGNE